MAKTKLLFGAAALMCLFSMVALAEKAKIYKCYDKNGTLQIYSVPPPECASQLPKKKEQPGDNKPKPAEELTPEQIEQQRRDNALLGTYTTEKEIDDALKRNLLQVDARINTIQMQIKTQQEDVDRYNKEKADMQKAGKPVDKGLQEEIVGANARLARLQNELSRAQAESEAIKARFAADKQRFIELTAPKQ